LAGGDAAEATAGVDAANSPLAGAGELGGA
jgi:hypothetical protein